METKTPEPLTRMEQLAQHLERMRIGEYVEYLQNPRRIIWHNFVAGVFRGLGMALGFSVLTALVLFILRRVVLLNLPVIGHFIAEIIQIVQSQIGP